MGTPHAITLEHEYAVTLPDWVRPLVSKTAGSPRRSTGLSRRISALVPVGIAAAYTAEEPEADALVPPR